MANWTGWTPYETYDDEGGSRMEAPGFYGSNAMFTWANGSSEPTVVVSEPDPSGVARPAGGGGWLVPISIARQNGLTITSQAQPDPDFDGSGTKLLNKLVPAGIAAIAGQGLFSALSPGAGAYNPVAAEDAFIGNSMLSKAGTTYPEFLSSVGGTTAAQTPGILDTIKNVVTGAPNPASVIKSGSGAMADSGMWDTIKSIAGPASNIVGALIGSNAAGNAVDAQIAAGQESNALAERMYNQNRSDLEPWRQAGAGAVNQLAAGIQPGGDLIRPFSMADYQADPGYNFRLSEGIKGIERSAAARGNLLSGGVLKGITRYGQDMASNEYQNAYNRYNQNQGNAYNRLAGVAGTGQNAVNQLGQAGQNYATNVGNTVQGIGNARASGYVGQANALAGGLAGAYNNYMGQNMLNAYRDRTGSMGGGATSYWGGSTFNGAFQDDY